MLTTIKQVSLKLATSAERGNVQSFLDRLLVEVASENYRYFLTEHVAYAQSKDNIPPEFRCWPPLLSNERQVSGLFATGLSKVCPISIPEHPISRSNQAKDEEDSDAQQKNGRVDFLAYYGNRSIALELKRYPISTLSDPRSNAGLTKQWEAVSRQAKEALGHMRDLGGQYNFPVSIGLLVVRVSRKVTSRKIVESARADAVDSLPGIADSVLKLTKADYLSYYCAPKEMQVSYGWGKSEDEHRVFPGVVFAAVVHGNASRK